MYTIRITHNPLVPNFIEGNGLRERYFPKVENKWQQKTDFRRFTLIPEGSLPD